MSFMDILRARLQPAPAPQAADPSQGGNPSAVTDEEKAAFIAQLQAGQTAPPTYLEASQPGRTYQGGFFASLPPWVLPASAALGVVLLAALLAPRRDR